MTLKECYAVLGLSPNADMADIKRAYRKLAFSLHPDLNPGVPDAARRFQRLNEAYVQLSHSAEAPEGAGGWAGQSESTAKAREEARKAYARARQGQARTGAAGAEKERGKEDVLKDILNDPFARRVFEDIYSHIRKEEPARASGSGSAAPRSAQSPRTAPRSPRRTATPEPPLPGANVLGKVKGWLKKQIDDEQVVRLPRESLVPGARVRLEIQHGFSGEPYVVEITLPQEFVPGKAMRLKGLGRRLGSLRGDLYVRIEPV